MKDVGGMLSFEVESREAGAKLCNALELCTCAVSRGDAETLIEHPASMTHSPYTAEELAEAGIPEGLIRLAVGLEEGEEIIADLKQAFAKL
jgi:methionine-gamma-lyase